jgi:hypothetical protein
MDIAFLKDVTTTECVGRAMLKVVLRFDLAFAEIKSPVTAPA